MAYSEQERTRHAPGHTTQEAIGRLVQQPEVEEIVAAMMADVARRDFVTHSSGVLALYYAGYMRDAASIVDAMIQDQKTKRRSRDMQAPYENCSISKVRTRPRNENKQARVSIVLQDDGGAGSSIAYECALIGSYVPGRTSLSRELTVPLFNVRLEEGQGIPDDLIAQDLSAALVGSVVELSGLTTIPAQSSQGVHHGSKDPH